MEDMKFVAYYRVSTQRQGESGLGIDAQVTAVENYIAEDKRRQLLKPVFKEIESGKSATIAPSSRRRWPPAACIRRV